MSETPIYDRLCRERGFYPDLRSMIRLASAPAAPVVDRTWDDEYWWNRKAARKSGVVL